MNSKWVPLPPTPLKKSLPFSNHYLKAMFSSQKLSLPCIRQEITCLSFHPHHDPTLRSLCLSAKTMGLNLSLWLSLIPRTIRFNLGASPKVWLISLIFFFFFLVCRFPLHLEKSVGCGNYSDYGCLCIFKGFRFQLVTHKKRVVWIQYTCTRYGHWAGVTIRSSLLCPYLVHVYWIQTTRFLWVTNWNRKPLNMHRHP